MAKKSTPSREVQLDHLKRETKRTQSPERDYSFSDGSIEHLEKTHEGETASTRRGLTSEEANPDSCRKLTNAPPSVMTPVHSKT